MIIGLDVDLTLVDTLTPWLEWYKFKTGSDLSHILEEQKDHGFNIQDLMVSHNSPLDFWKQSDLYDTLEPIADCIDVVSELQKDHDVIFISYCFPEHIESKVSFLNRFFGPNIKFVDTKHKEYIKMDLMIDDHGVFLEKIKGLQPNCKVIQKMTPINSLSELVDDSFVNWKEFIL